MSIRFQVNAPGANPRSWALDKDIVTIGRAGVNDVCVDDPKVSRFHAALVITRDHNVLVRDLGSQNGTRVNGRYVHRMIVRPEDGIQVGRITLSGAELQAEWSTARNAWQQQATYDRQTGMITLPNVPSSSAGSGATTGGTEPEAIFVEFANAVFRGDPSGLSQTDVLAHFLRFAVRLFAASRGVIHVWDGAGMRPRLSLSRDNAPPGEAHTTLERSFALDDGTRYEIRLAVPVAASDQPRREALLDSTVRVAVVLLNGLARAGIPAETGGEIRQACRWEVTFVTNAESVRSLITRANRIAEGRGSVLITGETGGGKTQMARYYLERVSRRRSREGITSLDCAKIPPSLVDSVLFGVGREIAGKPAEQAGYLEKINRRGLILTNLLALPVDVQTALAKALETRVVRRIGEPGNARQADVTVAAVTRYDPQRAAEEGLMSAETCSFFSRNVIEVPPLREHPEDIPLLACYFLDRQCPHVLGLSKAAIDKLVSYDWPGNVEQLRQVVLCAGDCCTAEFISPEHIVFDHDTKE